MQGLLNSFPIYFSLFSLVPLSIFLVKTIRNNSQLLMPNEYKTIKRIINKISDKNDLGENPITFTIVSGSRTSWIADSLGFVNKADTLYFTRNINPFISYKGKLKDEINEAIRQSYLLNSMEAFAWSNGTIAISRSSFRASKNKEDYLAFVIGHEISHILNQDSFNDSLKRDIEGKNLKSKKKILLGYKLSRESESKADIFSAKMLLNAGYPEDTAIKAHEYFSKRNGYGYATDKKSTHPGYEDRRKNIVEFLDKNRKAITTNLNANTKGYWRFNRKENTLTYFIKNRYLTDQMKVDEAAKNLTEYFDGQIIKN